MAKLESSFKNMLLALSGAALIASTGLGLVNDATSNAIATTEKNKQTNAIAAVLPPFEKLGDSYKMMPESGKDSLTVYPALDVDGNIIANAVKTYTYNGFGGYVEIMVGFDNSGNISGYQVLKHSETPGLGSKMNDWFRPAKEVSPSVFEMIFGKVETAEKQSSVIGKNPGTALSVSKDGGEIDAITAATISSRAFLDAINRAYGAVSKDITTDGQTSATKQL